MIIYWSLSNSPVGNDGLNCLVPFTDPLYKSYRPNLGLTVTAADTLTDHDTLAFHPEMSQDALAVYSEGKMAIVQNVGYPNPILSHFRGTDIWNNASDSDIYVPSGWVGRLLYGLYPDYPPQVIPTGSQPLAIGFG